LTKKQAVSKISTVFKIFAPQEGLSIEPA